MVRCFCVKYTKTVKFLSGSRGRHGLDLPSPLGQKFQVSVHILPDDGRSISRNVARKHYDSRHDKLRKQYQSYWIVNIKVHCR